MIWHSRRTFPLHEEDAGNHVLMDPHVLFCAESGAPILEKKTKLWGCDSDTHWNRAMQTGRKTSENKKRQNLAKQRPFFGFGKRGLLAKGSLRKVHFLENLENLEILENPQTVGKKGESDHLLKILESSENLEILEIPPVRRPLSQGPLFPTPTKALLIPLLHVGTQESVLKVPKRGEFHTANETLQLVRPRSRSWWGLTPF